MSSPKFSINFTESFQLISMTKSFVILMYCKYSLTFILFLFSVYRQLLEGVLGWRIPKFPSDNSNHNFTYMSRNCNKPLILWDTRNNGICVLF